MLQFTHFPISGDNKTDIHFVTFFYLLINQKRKCLHLKNKNVCC